MNIGLVGCGMISDAYLSTLKQYETANVVACADLNQEAANAKAQAYNLRKMDVDALLLDPEIDIILNLTPPKARTLVNMRAFEAEKHVYCEKPFALSPEDAQKTIEMAESRNLCVCGAPDSFLGGTQQTARSLINSGRLGEIKAGTAALMYLCGYNSNHYDLGFFFKKGAGPLFDMGPYYISSLVNLLGPVSQVAMMSASLFDERVCHKGSNQGKTYPVEIETHTSGLLRFANGAMISLTISFDVWRNTSPRIELFGTKGTLQLPEPSGFGGELKICEIGQKDWNVVPSTFPHNETVRGLGLIDMIQSLEEKKEPRCSGTFATHVLDVMCSLEKSAQENTFVEVETICPSRG